MDRQEVENALKIVDDLRKRALQITDKAPYFTYHSEPDWARVSIEGEEGVLHLCDADTEWESAVFLTKEVRFPAYLLFVSDQEMHHWQAEEYRLYTQRQSAKQHAAVQEKEANERAVYEALKRKFEPTRS